MKFQNRLLVLFLLLINLACFAQQVSITKIWYPGENENYYTINVSHAINRAQSFGGADDGVIWFRPDPTGGDPPVFGIFVNAPDHGVDFYIFVNVNGAWVQDDDNNRAFTYPYSYGALGNAVYNAKIAIGYSPRMFPPSRSSVSYINYTLIPDNTAPAVSVSTNYLEWNEQLSASNPRITFSAVQGYGPGVSYVKVLYKGIKNGHEVQIPIEYPLLSSGDTKSVTGSFVIDGVGVYEVDAYDWLGVCGSTVVTVKDIRDPSVSISGLPSPSSADIAVKPCDVTALASEISGDSGVGRISLSAVNEKNSEIDQYNNSVQASSGTVAISKEMLSSGIWKFSASGSDYSSPAHSSSAACTQKILAKQPTVEIDSPNPSDWYSTKTIGVEALDDLDEAIPTAPLAKSKLQSSASAASFPDDPAAWSGVPIAIDSGGHASLSFPEGISEGTFIGAMDQAGNKTIVGPKAFKIDVTAPQILIDVNGSRVDGTSVSYISDKRQCAISISDPSPAGAGTNSGLGPVGYSIDSAPEAAYSSDGFAFALAKHRYTFEASDIAGNESTCAATIAFNASPIYLPQGSDGAWENIEYRTASGEYLKLNSNNPISSAGLRLVFPKNSEADGQAYWGGSDQGGGISYAPPSKVEISFINDSTGTASPTRTYSFAGDGAGTYAAAIEMQDFGDLPDGDYTASYKLTDASGLARSGTSFPIALHNASPAAIDPSAILRYSPTGSGGANAWTKAELALGAQGSASSAFMISAGALGGIADPVAGLDGISFSYSDAPAEAALFPIKGYGFTVLDETLGREFSATEDTDQSILDPCLRRSVSSISYTFRWNPGETSRVLSLSVITEAGKSASSRITIIKPASPGFVADPPSKASGNQSFKIVWKDDGASSGPGWVEGVRWDLAPDSDPQSGSGAKYSRYARAPQAGGDVTLSKDADSISAGRTIEYEPVITNALGFCAIEVQGEGRSAYIGYEPLVIPALPSLFLGAGSASEVAVAGLPASAQDGMNIQYALCLESGGATAEYYPKGPDGGFGYSLWDLFGVQKDGDASASLDRLRAAMNGASLRASIVAWYGDPLAAASKAAPAAPVVKIGAFYAGGALSAAEAPELLLRARLFDSVGWDVTPPTLTLRGTLARPEVQTSTLVVSGSATDEGGSGLDSIQVEWAPMALDAKGKWVLAAAYSKPASVQADADGGFSYDLAAGPGTGAGLADGMYSVQVLATDRAGNQSSNSAVQKLLDTHAPDVALFHLDSIKADSSGSVTGTFSIDDGCGIGLPGCGLGTLYYRWVDESGVPAPGAGWSVAVIVPALSSSFDGLHSNAEGYRASFADIPSGKSSLRFKAADKAGNTTAEMAADGTVSFQANAPTASIEIGGWNASAGQYWIRSPSDLSVACAILDGSLGAARWNVQSVNPDGTYLDDSGTWGAWDAGFDSVRGLIRGNGQAYRIRLQVRNEYGVAGQIVSSQVFSLDGIGPQDVSASVASNSVVAGQAIRAEVSGNDPYSPLIWTWTYEAAGGSPTTMDYAPGSDIVIPSAGSYTVWFTAASGSGISANSRSVQISVLGDGLAVDDNSKFVSARGTVSGRWNYSGAAPSRYDYRWIRAGDGAVLKDWTIGNATNSSVLSLPDSGVAMGQGEVVQLEVKAMDDQGRILADERSAGATVDASAPAVSLEASPEFVSPNDIWLKFKADDSESGISGGIITLKKLSIDSEGKAKWAAAAHAAIPASSGQRVDLDMSGSGGLVSGDRVVAEVAIENGAGLTSTVETGVMLVDADPPPIPVVIPMATASDGGQVVIPGAVNQRQAVGFDFGFTGPDPVSGTDTYLWKAFKGGQDPSGVAWTALSPGTTKVNGLDFSDAEDGTVIFFAVMAVDGAGLSSIGYSRGIVLDSQAPTINDLLLEYGTPSGRSAIGAFARVSDLAAAGGVIGVFTAVDKIAGLSSFEIQAGTYSDAAGFAGIGAVAAFPSPAVTETVQESPQLPLSPAVGTVYAALGRAYNAAGNSSMYTSSTFQAVGAPPGVAALIANLGPNSLSFTWTVDQSPLPADFDGYSLSLTKPDGASLLKDSSGRSVPTILARVPAYTVADWKALGLAKGDSVTFTVTPQTQLGVGQSKTLTMSIQPDAPSLTSLDYTRYFGKRYNVKQVAYSVDSGIEQIQLRVRDGSTGQIIQGWTADYSGNSTSFMSPYPAACGIKDGQRLFIEVRAESQSGIWSEAMPTEIILVDETPPEGVAISRPAGALGAISSAYSNAMGNTGLIDGWDCSGKDDQSGILAYQAILLDSAEYAALMRSSSGLGGIDWSKASQPVPSPANPGAAWEVSKAEVGGAIAQTDYYAAVRVQNGTEDWSPPAISSVVHVSWVKPALQIRYDSSVLPNRDSTGNAITNADAETLTLASSEANTECALSVNGTSFGTVATGAESQGGVFIGSMTLAGPGTDELVVTGTDLYGNQSTVSDSLRFNQRAGISVAGDVKIYTTPGRPFIVEKALNVTADYRDYPLSYSLDLGSGSLVSFTGNGSAQCELSVSANAQWVPAGTTTAKYFQSEPKAQVSAYTLKISVTDAWGLTTTQAIPVEVDNTTSGKLYIDEYWTGSVLLSGIVEVPQGLSLTLDSVLGKAYGALDANDVMQGGIEVDSGGSLRISNGGAASSFDTYIDGYEWKGIGVTGSASGSGLEMTNAERGLTLYPGGALAIRALTLSHNLIGLHLLGGSLILDGGSIEGNSEYGIKEDGAGSFSVRNMSFFGNGVGYYRTGVTGITIPELNALPGNGGNR